MKLKKLYFWLFRALDILFLGSLQPSNRTSLSTFMSGLRQHMQHFFLLSIFFIYMCQKDGRLFYQLKLVVAPTLILSNPVSTCFCESQLQTVYFFILRPSSQPHHQNFKHSCLFLTLQYQANLLIFIATRSFDIYIKYTISMSQDKNKSNVSESQGPKLQQKQQQKPLAEKQQMKKETNDKKNDTAQLQKPKIQQKQKSEEINQKKQSNKIEENKQNAQNNQQKVQVKQSQQKIQKVKQPQNKPDKKRQKNEEKSRQNVNKKENNKPENLVQQILFKCSKNRQALYCCSEKNCLKPAIKCIGSHECKDCRDYHKKCPREIKISQIKQRADALVKTNPGLKITNQKGKGQDLIKILIDQLQITRTKINKLNVDDWGLSQNYLDIFKLSLAGKQGSTIAEFIDSQPIYPSAQFYVPAQFRKEVFEVQKVNRQLEARGLILYRVYKQLAQMDCQLKLIQYKIKRNSSIPLQLLQKLHIRLYQAIKLRLSLSREFAGLQQVTTDQELADFMLISKRLFYFMFYTMNELFKQKNFANVLKFIGLCRQLFDENRQQFRLYENPEVEKQIDTMKQLQGFSAYYCQKYQLAYSHLKNISDNKLDKKLIQTLIDICQNLIRLGNMDNCLTLLKYLLLFEKLDRDNVEVLYKIINCYVQIGQKLKIYEYYRKLNKVVKSSYIQTAELIRWLIRQIYCIQFDEKQSKYTQVFSLISEALELIRNAGKKNLQVMEIELKIRHMAIIFNKFNKSDYSNIAANAIDCCRRYQLQFKKVTQRNVQQQQSKYRPILKQYLLKFLLFQSQCTLDKQKKQTLLREANRICEELRLKIFEPAYQYAKLLYQIKHREALAWQDKANAIYPTEICYRQKAFLLYKQYFQNSYEETLFQCIQSANQSLLLMPMQSDLYALKGMANQNLKKHRQSNSDFKKAQQMGLTNFNIQTRIAQNNEFIVKASDLTQDLRKQLIAQAELIYKKCLAIQPHDKQCKMGYARVLKLLGNLKQAEQYFLKMIGFSQYSKEAYMFLGNIKQEMGKADDDRDFDLLQQALEYYKKAGHIKQNKQNLIRIYKELDRQRDALQIQNQTNWS